jgi:hypothetical protein
LERGRGMRKYGSRSVQDDPHALEAVVTARSWIRRPYRPAPSIAPFQHAIGNVVGIPFLSGFPLTLTASFRGASCNSGREFVARLTQSTNLVSSLVSAAGSRHWCPAPSILATNQGGRQDRKCHVQGLSINLTCRVVII